jgi:hypothetical protein
MSKPATGPLSPGPSPLQSVRNELDEAVEQATPTGALRAGIDRLETFAAEHPEFAQSIIVELKNLREEFVALAGAPNGGGRIAERLRRLELEMHARISRPNIYRPTPPRPSAFPEPKPSIQQRYPWVDQSSGLPK